MKKVTVVKHTGLLISSLIVVGAVIFAFTRPMLAPGFNPGVLGVQSPENSDLSSDNIFAISDSDGKVGQNVRADSFLIFNESTGEVIASKNPNAAVAIASITKLMTAYVVQKYGDLGDVWAIAPASTNDIRPILGLQIGDRVKVQDLVNAMLVGSANDAATALGQYLTSTKDQPITDFMNKEAKALGMASTHYENPIGFDSEQNYSTAEDLKRLLEVIRPMPLFSSLDRKQSYAFTSENGTSYSVKATNTLLAQDPELHAIKTGFTDEAGGAMITAVYHQDIKFIIIVLSSSDREGDTELLKKQVIEKISS